MTEPAPVLHVCDFAAPYGGAFIRQLELLDAELRRRGHGPSAYGFPEDVRDAGWCERLRAGGSQVHLLPRTSPRAAAQASLAVRRAIAATDCRIVHSHFGTYDVPVVLLPAAGRWCGTTGRSWRSRSRSAVRLGG